MKKNKLIIFLIITISIIGSCSSEESSLDTKSKRNNQKVGKKDKNNDSLLIRINTIGQPVTIEGIVIGTNDTCKFWVTKSPYRFLNSLNKQRNIDTLLEFEWRWASEGFSGYCPLPKPANHKNVSKSKYLVSKSAKDIMYYVTIFNVIGIKRLPSSLLIIDSTLLNKQLLISEKNLKELKEILNIYFSYKQQYNKYQKYQYIRFVNAIKKDFSINSSQEYLDTLRNKITILFKNKDIDSKKQILELRNYINKQGR